MTYIMPEQNINEILERINWRPGHMIKAAKEIRKSFKIVDIIIEVRDARLPLVSGNTEIYEDCNDTPHLIVLNKTNFADTDSVKKWEDWFNKQNINYLFLNALDSTSVKLLVKRSREILHSHRLKQNSSVVTKKEISMMILGLPNTGKSTIINKLSKRNATKAAATPGQTKVNLWIKADKGLKILDTPGLMPPEINGHLHAMWLSVIHAIPDHIITPEYSAAYITEHLLRRKQQSFKEHYKFDSLDLDLNSALEHIGNKRGCLRSGGIFDYDKIYKIILSDFRKGLLGTTSFESPPLR